MINKTFKNFFKFILIILATICFINPMLFLNSSKKAFALNTTSSEIVMEVNSKRVLYENNSNDKKYMASTTKILTAITVIENFDISEEIKVTSNTTGIEGSSIYLEAGEVLTVEQLLYGLMLRSGNDCAETLAVNLVGSIEKFACLMNDMAKKIGANDSNFVNPHGLHDDNHYTTAYDLALISSYAIKNPIFEKIVSTKYIEIPWTTREYNRKLYNKNKMLSKYEGANGIKTGFTKKAGRCLVTSCVKDGMELVCVVLNCPQMWERSSSLLDKFYDEYNLLKVIESDNIIDFYDTSLGDKVGVYVKNDIILPISKNEKDYLKIKLNYSNIKGFIKKDSEIGKVEIYCKNNLLFEEKIYNIVDINEK